MQSHQSHDSQSEAQPKLHAQQILTYSVEQACAVSSLSRTTLFGLIRQNKLSVTRIGRRTLISATSLRALLGDTAQ